MLRCYLRSLPHLRQAWAGLKGAAAIGVASELTRTYFPNEAATSRKARTVPLCSRENWIASFS